MCSGSFLFCLANVRVRRYWALKRCGVWNGLWEMGEGDPLRLESGLRTFHEHAKGKKETGALVKRPP